MSFLNNLNGLMNRKMNNRLDDLQASDLQINRQKVVDSLKDIVCKVNDCHDKSATYYELRFNYSYINKDLLKEGETLIKQEFSELEKQYAEILNNDSWLKEEVVITKADLLQRETLWEKARREVYMDLINWRRSNFWRKAIEKVERKFTETDYQRLKALEEKFSSNKALEAVERIKDYMTQEYPSFSVLTGKQEASQSKHSVLDDLTSRKSEKRLEDKKAARKEIPPMVR